MPDLATQISKAKSAGYSDADITAYLAKDTNFAPKVAEAKSHGYGDTEIVNFLGSQAADPAYAKSKATAAKADRNFGFADAVTSSLGVRDELAGGVGFLAQGAENLFRRATGKPVEVPASTAYRAAADSSDEAASRFAKEHPVQNALANVGGFAALGPAKGATSVLGSVTTGAGLGGAFGFAGAKGNLAERLPSAAVGTVIGGTLGATPALAPVGRRVGSALSEFGDRVRQIAGRTGGAPTASQVARSGGKAEAYVADLAKRAGATPESLRANPAAMAGKPVTAAEAVGRPGVSQLAAVSRRSGTTPDAAESLLRQRAQAMPERVVNDLHEVTGVAPDAVAGDFTAQTQRLRAEAKPLYDEAYAVGGVDSPTLQALSSRPSVKNAMNRAASIAQEEGVSPKELGFVVSPQKAPGGGTVDVVTGVSQPTAKTWDYVKRGLDDVLEGYRNPTTGKLNLDEAGRATLNTLNSLRGELTAVNPAYAKALAAGGEPLRLEEAYRMAPKLLNNATSEATFNQRYGALTASQQDAFKGGYLNSVYEGARSGRLKLKDMASPAFQTKAETVLGKDAAANFLDRVKIEADLARTGSRMTPGTGSPTMELGAADAEREATMSALGGAGRKLFEGKPVSAVLHAVGTPLAGLYRGAQAPLDQATRDAVGKILLDHPNVLADLLERQAIKPLPSRRPYNALAGAAGADAGRLTAAQLNGH